MNIEKCSAFRKTLRNITNQPDFQDLFKANKDRMIFFISNDLDDNRNNIYYKLKL